MTRLAKTLALAAGVLTVATALAAPALARSHRSAATVRVTEKEFSIAVSPRSVAHGAVVFTVANRGKLAHDFKIAGKKTATIRPGSTATLRVTFAKAGRYPYLCDVQGHAAAGMKGVLVVR